MASAETFKSYQELFNSLFAATDDQSDKRSLSLKELSREQHNILFSKH